VLGGFRHFGVSSTGQRAFFLRPSRPLIEP